MDSTNYSCIHCGYAITQRMLLTAKNGVTECVACGHLTPVPRAEQPSEVYTQLCIARNELDNCRFSAAITAYKKAAELSEKNGTPEPEAYFGLALAKNEIQYLYDHIRECNQPICYRVMSRKFSEHEDYKKALKYATSEQKDLYKKQAEEINGITAAFADLDKRKLDYDVFLCVKVSVDDDYEPGQAKQLTDDVHYADKIYNYLEKQGYRVFYSERSLTNEVGKDYEAHILYALCRAKTMLIVCGNEDYLHTQWVHNEYMRYHTLMLRGHKDEGSIGVVYLNEPIDHLPGIPYRGAMQGIAYNGFGAADVIRNYVEKNTKSISVVKEQEKNKKHKKKQKINAFSVMARVLTPFRFLLIGLCVVSYALALLGLFVNISNESFEVVDLSWILIFIAIGFLLGGIAKFIHKYVEALKDYRSRGALCKASHLLVVPFTMVLRRWSGFLHYFDKASSKGSFLIFARIITSLGGLVLYCVAAFRWYTNLSGEMDFEALPMGVLIFEIGIVLRFISQIIRGFERHAVQSTEEYQNDSQFSSNLWKYTAILMVFATMLAFTLKTPIASEPSNPNAGGDQNGSQSVLSEFEQALQLAEAGDAEAQFKVAGFYLNGTDGAEQNDHAASEWFTKAAEQDHVKSQFFLGYYYENGLCGLEQDYSKSQEWYYRAAALGYEPAIEAVNDIEEGFTISDGVLQKYTGRVGHKAVIPICVTSIGASAFENCVDIKSVVVTDRVVTIGTGAFRGCSNLESIELPNSVVSIEKGAFRNCINLRQISIPDSVILIDDNAFAGCNNLSGVELSNNLARVGMSAFVGCISLTDVVIPDKVLEIGGGAFAGCLGLERVTLPKHITEIQDRTFYQCINLKSIIIPNKVASIGEGAFEMCDSLEQITYAGSISEWNSIAKADGWNTSVPATVVHCTDGDVSL